MYIDAIMRVAQLAIVAACILAAVVVALGWNLLWNKKSAFLAEMATPRSITLAKQAKSLSDEQTNEAYIQRALAKTKGTLKIIGWVTKQVSRKTYLVTFEVFENGLPRGYAFEVNTEFDAVRDVFGSNELTAQYGFPSININENLSSIENIRKSFPNEKRPTTELVFVLGEELTRRADEKSFSASPDLYANYLILRDDVDRAQNRRFGFRFRKPTPEEFLNDVKLAD